MTHEKTNKRKIHAGTITYKELAPSDHPIIFIWAHKFNGVQSISMDM